MAKKMLIDATHAEETRVVVVDGNKVEEFDFESENKRQLAGNIYLAKVTRVEPSLQAAFVDYGGNRHGFLAFSEIHPDYYQIPVADREALMAEERAYAEAQRAEEDKPKPKRTRRSSSKAAATVKDAEVNKEVDPDAPSGMETIDLDEAEGVEGSSPMELVGETPVETPSADEDVSEDVADDTAELDADEDDAPIDDGIESVAEEDDSEDVRPVRKPRPRRYKIQEVVKVRQILLVQVVKEERGNKGAALTTYLSLAGRYCVLMPNTARGGGISRKITNAADRKKLKEIANEIDVPDGAGLIVRTAGAKRTKTEIKRDYEYLLRLWEQIRELTLKSVAPAKIYEEGDLIKRSIRDLYNREIDEILVEGEDGYRIAKDFMKMIMPSHARNVKRYVDQLPLFARYQVESYLSGMFNPTVQLKSGGYIVIDTTEALVAVDVNSGRATKEGSIEETALKTNLEAAEEVARQLRLRDLAGLIVIDFIDMDERRNNSSVEKRMKDKLKTDRARIQVGRISGFGLMEMSRQRLRPGMIEATTQPCPHCHGTGLLRSDDNLALSIIRQLEEEGVRGRSKEVLVKAPVAIANYLINEKRDHVLQIEARYGLSVRIEADFSLISPDFSIEKFKTATRVIAKPATPVVSVDPNMMDDYVDAPEDAEDNLPAAETADAAPVEGEEGAPPKKKRRRRRRRRSSGSSTAYGAQEGQDGAVSAEADTAGEQPVAEAPSEAASDVKAEAKTDAEPVAEAAQDDPAPAPKPKSTRSRSTAKSKAAAAVEEAPEGGTDAAGAEAPEGDAQAIDAEAKPATKAKASPAKKTTAKASTAKPKTTKAASTKTTAKTTEPKSAATKAAAKPKTTKAKTTAKAKETVEAPVEAPVEAVAAAAVAEVAVAPAPEPTQAPTPEPVAEVKTDEPSKPKRRGWWSLGK
ncbi:Rne/Rng family ribonuclease [Algirhabdus cladophorae]|uniref:Rne/Rng family ribonuclease n=1 Tax=Algirhabdus cladophorae TaxID=3377108 RepID=UPI003B84717F